ncbi:MAG: tetratricopeptide repeat protein [candidate division FCPU426 bacterium]
MGEDKFESSKEIEEKGFRLWERFELDEALQVFVEGIKRFPEDRKLKLGLAFTRLDLGDLPEARRLFQELLAMNSRDDECWWGLGRIHLLLSNYGEARYAFDQALHLGKPDERVLLDVAREWYLLSMYEEAFDFYRRALKINKKNAEALLGMGACQYWMNKEEPEPYLKKALDLDPGYHDARNFLANMYFSQKRYDEALEAFEKIPLEAQNDPLALRRMMRLLRKKGITPARLAPLKTALKRLNKEQGWDFFLSQIKRKGSSPGRSQS